MATRSTPRPVPTEVLSDLAALRARIATETRPAVLAALRVDLRALEGVAAAHGVTS
jgi:hypothetical protein